VVHQYRGENFTTSTWTDTAPSGPQADISITGVSPTTLNGARAASSDGVDDFGSIKTGPPGPETLPASETFGVAMVFKSSSSNDLTTWFGFEDFGGAPRFDVHDNDGFDQSLGEILVLVTDNAGNRLAVETNNVLADSQIHLVVINKTSDTSINFYVDDMSAKAPASTQQSQGFDHTDFSPSIKMGFFARNSAGSFDRRKSLTAPFFEFNEQPYSQQDRLNLKQRVPGL
jgi:hypothetical protein